MCSVPVASIEYSYRIGSIDFGGQRPEMAYEATLIVQLQLISFGLWSLGTCRLPSTLDETPSWASHISLGANVNDQRLAYLAGALKDATALRVENTRVKCLGT